MMEFVVKEEKEFELNVLIVFIEILFEDNVFVGTVFVGSVFVGSVFVGNVGSVFVVDKVLVV